MVVRWGEGGSAGDARRRADEMLSLLGLGKKAHLRPSEMSGGEKQRVAIGRALIKEPEFCFADEPTSALDWAHGEQIIELLRNAAHERNSTVLIVAHDARIIPYVDRVYNLEDGCLHEGEEGDRAARPPRRTPAATATSRLTFPASIEEFPPMNRAIKALSRPRLNVWLVGVLAATAAALTAWALTSRADAPSTVSSTATTPSDMRYNFMGFVDLEQGVTPLYPLQPGRVVKVFAHDGDAVEEDAPLFTMDGKLAVDQIDMAEADLRDAQLQLEEAQKLAAQHQQQIDGQKQAVEARKQEAAAGRAKADEAKRLHGSQNASAEDGSRGRCSGECT